MLIIGVVIPELTDTGLDQAVSEIEALREKRFGVPVPISQVVPGREPVVEVYGPTKDEESASQRVLEILAAADGLLTPDEIGELWPGGAIPKASVRAAVRNVGRREKRLIQKGMISRPVLIKNFDDYDAIGSGRYGLRDDDRATLTAHVAKF